jgi:putative glycosyltransferase
MQLSIVATLYCSSPYVAAFVERAGAAARSLGLDYEILLVDDGSPDDSLARAVAIAERDPRVRIVELARNFGHHRAMMIGLEHSRGERVFLLDVDLEEAPELLSEFHARLEADPGVDVVYGQLARRKGDWFERVSGEVFYSVVNRLGGVSVPRNIVTARLMRRSYVDALLQYREREIFIAGLWAATGFRQVAHPVTKVHKGETTYNLRRKLSILLNSITAFSNRPLHLIFMTGLGISSAALLYALYLVIATLFLERPPSGWASLIVSIWLLGGLTIFFLGVIGIYLAKIFIEVKQRPYGTVRRIHGVSDDC